jgi:hypothetical protein
MTRRTGTVLAIVLALASCGGGGEAGTNDRNPAAASPQATAGTPDSVDGGTVVVRQDGCRLEPGDAPIPAGPVTFEVQNRTAEAGAVNIAPLEGATFARFERHVREEIRLAHSGEPVLGHPPFAVPIADVRLEPGSTAGELVADLDRGSYVLTCARIYEEVDELRPSGAMGPIEVS